MGILKRYFLTSQLKLKMSLENENAEKPGESLIELAPKTDDKKEMPDQKQTPFDPNIYAITKTVTKGLLNVALLTTNANQLKNTIENGPEKNRFYVLVVGMAILSIILQTIMGTLGVFVGAKDINYDHNQPKATAVTRTILILGVITVIVNIILASFSK